MTDVASAWALKGTEDGVPGGEHSKTKGTETGKAGPPSRNVSGSRAQGKGGAFQGVCNVRMKSCTLHCGAGATCRSW